MERWLFITVVSADWYKDLTPILSPVSKPAPSTYNIQSLNLQQDVLPFLVVVFKCDVGQVTVLTIQRSNNIIFFFFSW